MLARCRSKVLTTGVVCLLHLLAKVSSSLSFPLTVHHFASDDVSCPERRSSVSMPDGAPQLAMMQKHFKTVAAGKTLQAQESSPEGSLYRWGANESHHPRSIGKYAPHPKVQNYEASMPHLAGMVLNIWSKVSNGDGGLVLAMEVQSPCGGEDSWVEVDRSRCSSRYPCALRLPASAVRSSETEPTKFRTVVISADEDYLTDFLEYERVTLDPDAEVVVAHEKYEQSGSGPLVSKTLKFRLSPVLSAGALTVMPVIKGGNADTVVTMRLRQPQPFSPEQAVEEKLMRSLTKANKEEDSKNKAKSEQSGADIHQKNKEAAGSKRQPEGNDEDGRKKKAILEQSDADVHEKSWPTWLSFASSGGKSLSKGQPEGNEHADKRQKAMLEQSGADMHLLETTLQSYRAPWAGEWRSPSQAIGGCDFSLFEVVADQLYPGEVELEIWATGSDEITLSDVLVTTRISWSEAEVSLLDTILKDHFAFFNDPDEIVHGLPMDALKAESPKQLTDSNPCEWGYAMESWVIMAETGFLKPEEAVEKLNLTFDTLITLQNDPDQYAHGLFYPYYRLRDKESGKKLFPKKTESVDMPCGDDALLYASMMMIQGWLKTNDFHKEADTCAGILGRMDFSHCVRMTDCNSEGNGIKGAGKKAEGDRFWSVPLTFKADTLEHNTMNWNVWADEGGLVTMIVALNGAVNDTQYESIVRQQQRYSPCTSWEGVTVGHAAFFNSIFTLPTRSMLGFGTLFSSPYYHEFAVRSVLPSFRAHQKLKGMLKVDYMGPSDAMSMMPREHPGKFFGSYAYWPPNNMYDCRQGQTTQENQCT